MTDNREMKDDDEVWWQKYCRQTSIYT